MEFELDDYRTGKIKQKRRNLSCVKEPQNYCKNNYTNNNNNKSNNNNHKKTENKSSEKVKSDNSSNNTIEKQIYVNSNNNYLIAKLRKENETLRLKLSKYENNNNRFKPIDNKIRQKKIENNVRITKKNLNNKQLITKSSNNISNFANYTYTNNFYNAKDNKYKTNNNSSLYNNYNSKIFNTNTMTTNSFVVHDKKNIKNGIVKSLSVFRSSSKNKAKNNEKIIYDKIKTNYKKMENKLSNSNISNYIEMKLKERKEEKYLNNLNTNNSLMHTLNSNLSTNFQKNLFLWKKKFDKDKINNLHHNNSNVCNTDRKKTETNGSNSNSKERNSHNIFIPNNEFNLTWSRFTKKSIETSFDQYYKGDKNKPEIILSSKNRKINDINLNNSNNKIS